MEISEVKVKLMKDRSDRLKAFCSITMDREFVIRDLKIIEGTKGMFVAMPSRKITDKCPTCSAKNHLRAKFCNECGSRLDENRAGRDAEGRAKLHADIAHPINSSCRERMQEKIVEEYEQEVGRAGQPGYRPSYEDDFDEIDFIDGGSSTAHASPYDSYVPSKDEEPEEKDEDEEPEEKDDDLSGVEISPAPADDATEEDDSDDDPFGAGIF